MLGRVVCHQQPERSVFFGGIPLPLCARCMGIYAGMLFTALFMVIAYTIGRVKGNGSINIAGGSSDKGQMAALVAVALCTLPMQFDGIGNVLGLLHSSAWVRYATGGAFGFALAVMYVFAMSNIHKLKYPCAGLTPFMLAVAGTSVFLSLFALYVVCGLHVQKNAGIIIGLVLGFAVVAVFSAVAYLLIVFFTRRRGIRCAMAAFALTLTYVAAANAARSIIFGF